MNKYLVKFAKTWADEINCQQFAIMEAASINELKETIISRWASQDEICIGSNKFWEPSEMCFEDDVNIIPLCDPSAELIESLIGCNFGVGGLD